MGDVDIFSPLEYLDYFSMLSSESGVLQNPLDFNFFSCVLTPDKQERTFKQRNLRIFSYL